MFDVVSSHLGAWPFFFFFFCALGDWAMPNLCDCLNDIAFHIPIAAAKSLLRKKIASAPVHSSLLRTEHRNDGDEKEIECNRVPESSGVSVSKPQRINVASLKANEQPSNNDSNEFKQAQSTPSNPFLLYAASETPPGAKPLSKTATKSTSQNLNKGKGAVAKKSVKSTPVVKRKKIPTIPPYDENKIASDGSIWTGVPDEPLEGGWPMGWMKKIFVRKSGASAGHTDRYWYTPECQYKLRSMVEVRKFLENLRTCKGDEVAAKRMMNSK